MAESLNTIWPSGHTESTFIFSITQSFVCRVFSYERLGVPKVVAFSSKRAAVVAQLADWLLTIPKVRCSNPVIRKFCIEY